MTNGSRTLPAARSSRQRALAACRGVINEGQPGIELGRQRRSREEAPTSTKAPATNNTLPVRCGPAALLPCVALHSSSSPRGVGGLIVRPTPPLRTGRAVGRSAEPLCHWRRCHWHPDATAVRSRRPQARGSARMGRPPRRTGHGGGGQGGGPSGGMRMDRGHYVLFAPRRTKFPHLASTRESGCVWAKDRA